MPTPPGNSAPASSTDPTQLTDSNATLQTDRSQTVSFSPLPSQDSLKTLNSVFIKVKNIPHRAGHTNKWASAYIPRTQGGMGDIKPGQGTATITYIPGGGVDGSGEFWVRLYRLYPQKFGYKLPPPSDHSSVQLKGPYEVTQDGVSKEKSSEPMWSGWSAKVVDVKWQQECTDDPFNADGSVNESFRPPGMEEVPTLILTCPMVFKQSTADAEAWFEVKFGSCVADGADVITDGEGSQEA